MRGHVVDYVNVGLIGNILIISHEIVIRGEMEWKYGFTEEISVYLLVKIKTQTRTWKFSRM